MVIKAEHPLQKPLYNFRYAEFAATFVAMKCTAVVYVKANKPTGMAVKKDYIVKAPGKREMLIKVSAASINPMDSKLPKLPFTGCEGKAVGFDVCGEVVQIGDSVQKFKVGDVVFTGARGSLCEYCIVQEASTLKKPLKVPTFLCTAEGSENFARSKNSRFRTQK